MYLTEVLERCSNAEARMARLYRLLAKRFTHSTEKARLWNELALEDETHADILRRERANLEDQEDGDTYMPEYAERLECADRALAELEEHAERLSSLDDATAVALALEQSTLEDLYDDLVLQGPPTFRLICERIEAALAAAPAAEVPGLPRRRLRRRTVAAGRAAAGSGESS
jgi:hypothetical protein